MNSSIVSVINNHNSIEYIKKRDENFTNRYLRENYGLPESADVDDMSPACALNQYFNTQYNNKHHNIQSNCNISTLNKS